MRSPLPILFLTVAQEKHVIIRPPRETKLPEFDADASGNLSGNPSTLSTMSNQVSDAALDESIPANDLVRFMDSEIQRLMRELQEAKEAEARLKELSSKVVIKKEGSSDTKEEPAATERIQQLLQETAALKAKYQGEKEKRKILKARISELKSKAPDTSKLQNKLEQSHIELEQTRAGLNDMQDQIDTLILRNDQDKAQLEEAENRIALLTELTRNDPWSYITEVYERHSHVGFHRLNPFHGVAKGFRDKLDAFRRDSLKPRGIMKNRAIYRMNDVLWSHLTPGFGISVEPTVKYVPKRGVEGFNWVTNKVQPIKGPFELFYETCGYWYYFGTYSTSVIESRNNASFFGSLLPRFQNNVVKESVCMPDMLPPIVMKSIRGLYDQGILPVSCTIFERIGFDQALNDALLEFGRNVKGPEFVLDIADTHTKKRFKAEEASIPPNAKKIRVGAN